MTIDNNKLYSLKGEQIKDLADRVRRGYHVLTENDYNWNSTGNPKTEPPFDCVCIGLLPDGMYELAPNLPVNIQGAGGTVSTSTVLHDGAFIILSGANESFHNAEKFLIFSELNHPGGLGYAEYSINNSIPTLQEGILGDSSQYIMRGLDCSVSWTGTLTHGNSQPLSAVLGRELNMRIQASSPNAPDTTTPGNFGSIIPVAGAGVTPHLYMCTDVDQTDPQNVIYTWTQII